MTAPTRTHRFTEWCRATGVDPEDARPPHHEFVIWVGHRWDEWKAERGVRSGYFIATLNLHADFDAWLTQRVNSLLAESTLAKASVST